MKELGAGRATASREVPRWSRTDKDWCHLLEACQVFDTLILDEDQVYDPNEIDDRLVLGVKGTLSVAELKVLRMGMLRGRDEKASRGELRMRPPPGFSHDPDGGLVLHPDRRVREAVELIFRMLGEHWSARQVFMWLHDNRILVPANHRG